MKLSNFELTKVTGKSALDLEYFADVDVETGFLFWKKTAKKCIRREYLGEWHFCDTGKSLPNHIYELARAWKAKTGQHC